MGVPVVCSRSTAAADWIEDGVNGFLVDPGDVATLTDRLERLRDDALAERMGRAAYERYWRSPPTTAAHAERLLACYRRILEPVAKLERSEAQMGNRGLPASGSGEAAGHRQPAAASGGWPGAERIAALRSLAHVASRPLTAIRAKRPDR